MSSGDELSKRGRSRLWISLALLGIVLSAAAVFFVGWYRGYRDWNNSKAAPLFSDIEPGGFTEVNVPSLAKSGDQGNSGFHH